MNIRSLFFDVCRILIDPQNKWPRLLSKDTDYRIVFKQYTLPLLIVLGICLLLGGLCFTSRLTSSVGLVVIMTITEVLSIALSIYLTSYIVNETAPNFKLPYHFNRVFLLVTYSWTPIIVTYIIVGLLPFLAPFKVVCLYSIYLLWIAMPSIKDLPADKKVAYTATIALVSWILQAMISVLLLKIGRYFL